MEPLVTMHCVPYRKDEPALAEQEFAELHSQVREWNVIVRAGIKRLHRCFTLADFAQALCFANQVGALAEAENHHPAILIEWGKATVTWWTHAVLGLHRNDFIAAAKTDRLFASD